VFDDVYSGIGVTKLDAKMNAAANAVDALQRNGVIAARSAELKAERLEADWLKRHAEGPPEIPRYDHRVFGQFEFVISRNKLHSLIQRFRDEIFFIDFYNFCTVVSRKKCFRHT